jgi:hypothetical protein
LGIKEVDTKRKSSEKENLEEEQLAMKLKVVATVGRPLIGWITGSIN